MGRATHELGAAEPVTFGHGVHTAGYFEMTALPDTLWPAEPLARAVYQDGWRPAYALGPTRDELVDVIRATGSAA